MGSDNKDDFPAAWQWPGLWSVNLLIFVVLWHQLFVHSFGMWFDAYHFFATAGLAWPLIAAERWLYFFREKPEAIRALSGDVEEQKGRMVRICLLILAGLILVAIVGARTRETAGMLLWTAAGGTYLVALFIAPRPTNEALPREMALATYLAGAAALFVWANAGFSLMRLFLPGMLLLLLLFYYLCLASSWSPLVPAGSAGPMLSGEGGRVYRSIPWFLVIASVLLLIFNRDRALTALFLSIGVSALMLLLLDFRQKTMPKPFRRLFADLAMLSPILPLLIL